MEKVCEGKSKIMYKQDDMPHMLVQRFKNDITAFDGKKKDQVPGKGVINKEICECLFHVLESNGVPTHMMKVVHCPTDVPRTDMYVRHLAVFPIEVIVRNALAGSARKRFGSIPISLISLVPGLHPIVEFCLKDDALGDPFISPEYIEAFKLTSNDAVNQMRNLAVIVNSILFNFLKECGIFLADFKLEFGVAHVNRSIVVADEISCDGCRFWWKYNQGTGAYKSLDKDVYRETGSISETHSAYQMAHKLITDHHARCYQPR